MTRIPFRPLFVLAATLALLAIAPSSKATPYATALTNSGTSISFRLNEAADSVKIISSGGAITNDLGALPAGLQTVALTIAGTFSVEVNKNPGFGYLQGIPTQISFDTNKFVRFNAPRGVAINRNPASPYFGRIYVSNADTGSVAIAGFPTRAMPQGDGIYMINADFTDAAGQGDVAKTAGLNWRNPVVTDQANKPFRIEVGEDDNLYISDYTTPTNAIYTGNLYVTDPNVSDASGLAVFDTGSGNAGRMPSSAIVKGSLGGGNLTVYAVSPDKSFDYDFGGFPAASFSVMQRWDVGAGPLPSAVAPVRVTDLPILIADVPAVLSDIDIAPDGKYFIAQNRSAGNEGGLFVVDPAQTAAQEPGFPDVVFNSYASSIAFFGATNDLLFQTRAVKVSPDNSVVALVRDDNRVWIIPLVNGLPDLGARRLMNNGVTTTLGRDISFDAVGNLYTVSSGQAAVHVFSPGFGSRATTGSDGTFNFVRITNASPLVSISSTDTNLYERMVADTGNFIVTRLGDISGPLDVTVSYTGAGNGVDFQNLSTTVTIPADSISATVTVTPVDNLLTDGPRPLVVTVEPNAGYTVSTPSTITLLIRDDEQSPVTPVLFSDDFDTDTSGNYTVRFGADNGVDDKLVAFNYDYSADSIASAPSSVGGTTRGLKVTANKDGMASAAGVNVYANGLTLNNDFAVRFDMYLRFGVAAGTTEHAIFGFNHSGNVTNRALSANALVGGDGVWCAIETDGSASSTARSYAIFNSASPSATPTFSSASARTFDPFFTAPPFAGIPGGAPSGQWVDVELSQTNNAASQRVATLKINAVTILSRTNTSPYTSGTIMLGHMDSFASIGSVNNYTIYDNVRVINLTKTPIVITAITPSGGSYLIDFTADPAALAGSFTLESSTALPGGFGPDAGSSIVAMGPPGSFRATSPNSGGTARFFRIEQ